MFLKPLPFRDCASVMPKSAKSKYYAVVKGRDGPKLYTSWDECKKNTMISLGYQVSRYPGAVHRSFTNKEQAEDWLASTMSMTTSSRPPQAAPTAYATAPQVAAASTSRLSPDRAASASDVTLSPEQASVLLSVTEGRNVFFTGSAGTGKSVLLREIIKCRGGIASKSLGITASTGIASVNIGGATLHSWAGIGLGQETAKNLAGKFIGQPKFSRVLDRWREVETLIIDEISMVDGALFDKLEQIARKIRGNDLPFGGIQLVLSGDFCQLPPVPGRRDGVQLPTTFAFEAESWDACVGRPVILTRVFRQKDQAFATMLNAMRYGQLDSATIQKFRQLSRRVDYTDGIEPTELFATRAEVDNANTSRLRQLTSEIQTYEASEYAGIDSKGERVTQLNMERLLDRLVVPRAIQLKVGAQVMLVKNLVQGRLVNGTVGQVIGFSTSAEAIANGIHIVRDGDDARPARPAPDGPKWPVVKFVDGDRILVIPAEFTVNNADGGMEAKREQIPLILAWALSVHKSQGQTLDRVKVDLQRIFEKGQAYVALSRATTMEHLQVLNFEPSKVVAHERVLAWYGVKLKNLADDDDYDQYFDEMDTEEALEAFYS